MIIYRLFLVKENIMLRLALTGLISASVFIALTVNTEGAGKDRKEEVAHIETSYGTIVVRFFPDIAPAHVENFISLAKKGFYDGCRFHRVIPGFMIQGGDPSSKSDDRSKHGFGGSEKTIKAEFTDYRQHIRGIVSMARSDDPNSASSQFFIMVDKAPRLDGKYSIFGEVIEGMDAVDRIVNLERDGRDNPVSLEDARIKSVKIKKARTNK